MKKINILKYKMVFLLVILVAGCGTLEMNDYLVKNKKVVKENNSDVRINALIRSTIDGWCVFKLYCKTVSSYPYNLMVFMETKQTNYNNFTVEEVEIVYQNGDRSILPQKVVLKSSAKIDNHDRYQYDVVFKDILSEANKYEDAHISIKGFTESADEKYEFSIVFDTYHHYEKRTEAAMANAG